jgi:hypothetical protein
VVQQTLPSQQEYLGTRSKEWVVGNQMQWIDISRSQQLQAQLFSANLTPSHGSLEFDEHPQIRSQQWQSIAWSLVIPELPDWPFREGAWQSTWTPGLLDPCLAKSPSLRFLFFSSFFFLADRDELVDAIVDCVLIHKVTLRPPFFLLISPRGEIFTIFDTLVSFSLPYPPVPFVLLQHWTAAVQFHTNTWIGALVICIRRSIV